MLGGNFTLFLIQENITAFNKDVSVNGTTTIFNDLMQDDNDDNSNVTTKTNPLHPKYNIDKDSYISISNELRPAVERDFEEFIKEVNVTANSASSLPPPPTFHEKCIDLSGCPVWMKSHLILNSTLSIIENISPNIDILILQGENDTKTPVQQALLLQQRLTEVSHPDHTLITYPDLGHMFYPSNQWAISVGPIQEYVLQDMFEQLTSPARKINSSSNMH